MPDPINIVIIGTDKTAGAFGSVSKGLGGIASSAQGTLKKGLKVGALAFAGLGVAAAGAATAIGAGIMKMTLDAAELEGVSSTFDLLAQSIGSEMTPALEGMREATRGMVSDADLMQAGNKFMAMGLANTSEEMNKLSEVATQLGSAMGEGPTESMENFALMMANQSIPRLDSFGISSGQVRTRMEELMDATEGMTREMAFNQAVMEQAEITMARVGEQGATSASSIARIQSTVENTALGIGNKFIPVLKEMLVPIADLVQKVGPQLVEWAGKAAEWLGARLPGMIEKGIAVLERLGVIFQDVFYIIQAFLSGAPGDFPWEDILPPWLAEVAYEVSTAFEQLRNLVSFLVAEITTGAVDMMVLAEILENLIPRGVVDAIFMVGDAVSKIGKFIAENVASFITWKDVMIALGVGIASIVLPAVAGLVISIASVLAPILLVIAAVAALRLAWEKDFLGMQTMITNLLAAAGPAIESIIAWFQDMIPQAVAAARSAFEFLAGLWQSVIQPAVVELGAAFAELWAALQEAWVTIAPIFAELGKTIGAAFGVSGGEALKFTDIIKVSVDALVIALKVLIAIVTVAAKVVGGAAQLMGKFWDKHGKTVLKIVGFIAKGFKKTFDQIFKIVDKALKAILKIWRKLFGNSELLDSASRFGQQLVRTFISFLGGVLSEIASFASAALRSFEKLFRDLVAKTIAGMRDLVAKIIAGLADALSRFEAWTSETLALIIRFFVDLVREAVRGLVKFVSEIAKGLADAMSAFETWIASVISAIVSFFVDLVREAVQGLAKFVSEIAKGLADAKREFETWIASVISDIISFFADLVSEAAAGLAKFVSEIAAGLARALSEFTSWISNVLADIAAFFSDLAAEASSGLVRFVAEIAAGLANALSEFAAWISSVLADIAAFFSDLASAASQGMSSFVAAIISGLADAAREFVTWGADILASVGQALQSIIDAVNQWAGEVKAAFKTALEGLAAVPGEIAGLLRQIGADIINFVVEGIQAVGDFVSRVIQQLTTWFNDVYASVLTGFQVAIDIGKLIVTRVQEGFETAFDFAGGVIDKLKEWLDDVLAFGSSIWSSAKEIGEKIIQQVMDGIGSMAESFKSWLRRKFEEWLESIFSPIPSARYMGMQIVSEVLQGIAGQGDAFTNSLRNMMSSWVANASSGLTASISPALAGVGAGDGLAGVGGSAGAASMSFANTFNTNISSAIDEEEFYYRVQEAQRQTL